eukprot:1155848-Pelagomonas_calceolata.AAC.8
MQSCASVSMEQGNIKRAGNWEAPKNPLWHNTCKTAQGKDPLWCLSPSLWQIVVPLLKGRTLC